MSINIKKTKFSSISNITFFAFAIFTLALVWINYYLHNLKISLALSIILSSILTVILVIYKIIIYKIKQSKQPIYSIDNLKNSLLLTPYNIIIDDIITIFNLTANKLTETHYTNKDTDYYFYLSKEEISDHEIFNSIKHRTSNNIIIFCITSTKKIEIENCNMKIFNIDDIYKKYLSYNHPISHYTKLSKPKKIKFKEILTIIINKSKSKTYFLYGLLIIITSLFTPYGIYYIITGTILIILSILSHFINTNKKTIKNS